MREFPVAVIKAPLPTTEAYPFSLPERIRDRHKRSNVLPQSIVIKAKQHVRGDEQAVEEVVFQTGSAIVQRDGLSAPADCGQACGGKAADGRIIRRYKCGLKHARRIGKNLPQVVEVKREFLGYSHVCAQRVEELPGECSLDRRTVLNLDGLIGSLHYLRPCDITREDGVTIPLIADIDVRRNTLSEGHREEGLNPNCSGA
jgi:hypothetical protein